MTGQKISVVCAGSYGVEIKEEQFLESIAGLCLALQLKKYGFCGYQLEACIFYGPKRNLFRHIRRMRKKGHWIYVVRRKKKEFLLFTDSPAALLSLQSGIRRLSALEVLMTAFCRH